MGFLKKQWQRFQELPIYFQVIGGIGVIMALLLLGLVFAIIIGIGLGDSEGVAAVIASIRDVFIILLAMQGLIISAALVVLVLQFAALVNLLQNEISPIIRNIEKTSQTVRGTTEFLSENAIAPVIEAQAWISGLGVVGKAVSEIMQINRILRRKQANHSTEASDDATPTV